MSVETLLQKLRKVKEIVQKPILRSVIGGLVMAVSLGYLGSVLARNWQELMTYDWHVDYGQAALAFVYYSVALAFAVLAWNLIMSRLTQVKNPTKHLKYYVYTQLLRRLPAPLLQFFGRAYLYEREGIAKSVTVAISLLEWILIILSGTLVYLLTLPFLPLPPVWRSPWVLGGILIIGALLVRPRTIRAVFRLMGKEDLGISFRYSDLLLWLIIYSLVWIGGGLVLYVAINSLYALPLAHLPAVIGIWVLSGLIPTLILVTPVGLGLKELTLSVLLGHLMPPSLAVIVALFVRVGLTLFELIWGIFVLRL
jgi:hypothetical protein